MGSQASQFQTAEKQKILKWPTENYFFEIEKINVYLNERYHWKLKKKKKKKSAICFCFFYAYIPDEVVYSNWLSTLA